MANISNIQDQSTRNMLRELLQRVARIESQMSTFVKNNSVAAYHSQLIGLDYASSGHTGFAATADLSGHTGDSTIHFTADSIGARLVHVGASAPTNGEHFWIDTSGGAGAYATKHYNGSSWIQKDIF